MYRLGKDIAIWKQGVAQNLTFIVTEDCNLRCKYCYITHKTDNKKMNFNIAKKFIDYVLSDEILRPKGVVLDFIGGEPLLEVNLIDQICDYFKMKTYIMKDDWYWNYRINITTNGVNYSDDEVQKFINKNKGKLEIAISIDGIKEKHDLNRIFPNGEGSYDKILKNIELYKSQFEPTTKVTFSSKDLKYLKDSIIHLWKLGFNDIAANVVFEDVWEKGDDLIFQEQLEELADYVITNKLFDKYACTFFDQSLGFPNSDKNLDIASCGAGKMIAVGPDGNIYPCMRFKNYSLNYKKEITIGDVDSGIDFDKLRPYYLINTRLQSDEECINCRIATGCNSCFGFNYDMADTNTNFQRAKFICPMHKARVKANNYYFSELYKKYNIKRIDNNPNQDKLYFLLSENPVNYCPGSREHQNQIVMGKDTIIKGLEFARDNFLTPVFIHDKDQLSFDFNINDRGLLISHICPLALQKEIRRHTQNYILVIDGAKDLKHLSKMSFEENIILNLESENMNNLCNIIKRVFKKTNRINLNILDIVNNFNYAIYQEQLDELLHYIYKRFIEEKAIKELNVITDELFMDKKALCDLGLNSFTLVNDGKIYVCPEFYFDAPNNNIGSLKDGIKTNYNRRLYSEEYSPLCRTCKVCHCISCSYINLNETNEVNIPPKSMCIKSGIEYRASEKLGNLISNKFQNCKRMKSLDHLDPYINALDKNLVNGLMSRSYVED